MNVPVVTIDGPSGSGKGTVSARVAAELGWHFLDSGSLYRLLALAAMRRAARADKSEAGEDAIIEKCGGEQGLIALAHSMKVEFGRGNATSVRLDGEEVSGEIRQEQCGILASRIAALGPVREALLERQKEFRQSPGLIADGRDMGTVVFPQAAVKVFLTASAQERAERRYKQLIAKGVDVILTDLLLDIKARDERDSGRAVSPLRPAGDAVTIDTTELSIDQVVVRILDLIRSSGVIPK